MGGLLIALAATTEARWAAFVFMLTSVTLFNNSALYHHGGTLRVTMLLRRIDHAAIFLLIAGTYTPLSLLALSPSQGLVLLSIVWGVALLGVAFRIFWLGAPRWLYVPIYIGLGWAAVFFFKPLFEANATMMILVLIGGLT